MYTPFEIHLKNLTEEFYRSTTHFIPLLAYAIVVWFGGNFLLKFLFKNVKKYFVLRGFNPTLQGFLMSILSIGSKIVLLLFVVSILGIQTVSFAAVFAGVGVAIGSAFNGSLGNFAGGVMIILYKPIQVGDIIKFNDIVGKVVYISIFNTEIETGDRKTVYIPNGMITTGIVTNWSKNGLVRVDVPFSIDLSFDISKAKEIAIRAMKNHPKVLKNPTPEVFILGVSGGALQLSLRSYAKPDDYWNIFDQIHELVLDEYKKSGIEQPIPKQIVISKNE
jgi:small conductance mechanosensitive channel